MISTKIALVDLMFQSPIVACKPDVPNELHAATMQAIAKAWPKPEEPEGMDLTVSGACGISGLKLIPAKWPPRVSSLPAGWVRCKACYDATGKMRPRTAFNGNAE